MNGQARLCPSLALPGWKKTPSLSEQEAKLPCQQASFFVDMPRPLLRPKQHMNDALLIKNRAAAAEIKPRFLFGIEMIINKQKRQKAEGFSVSPFTVSLLRQKRRSHKF
uniref:Uncharacterized protein ORF108_2 n=1 Tax=Nothoceros aenigmaticus TaxID=13813 RepID=C3RYQ8_9EMBR|nr:hypothetical protein MeaeMp57 [Nothoceros aenigmaticus]ACC86814.1 hypothetical protein MeaeMp57 [Nothoceros aenigmaticus]